LRKLEGGSPRFIEIPAAKAVPLLALMISEWRRLLLMRPHGHLLLARAAAI
jgi:hypothetical protein